MKILITGGCGFVGSNLAVLFAQHYEGAEIYCFDNLYRRGSELNLQKILAAGVRFIHGDVRQYADFERVPKVDVVIDAAAEPSVLAGVVPGELENLMDTNLMGTIHTLYFARRHYAKFVFLSTSRVYPYDKLEKAALLRGELRFDFRDEQPFPGLSGQGVSENFPLEGVRSLYGATKLSGEYFIQEFAYNFQIPSVINRCGVLSGPYQMGKVDQGVVVLWMARHFWKGKLSYIGYGGEGHQVRDMLHVRDLFHLLDWQIQNMAVGAAPIFNVGGGLENSVSLAELTELCRDITGNRIEISPVEENRPGDLPIYVTDNRRIHQHSGWKPATSVPAMLEEIHRWMVEDEKLLKPILA